MSQSVIRDRVKELRRVPANELVPHPQNWRRHPQAQVQAFRGALQEIGFSTAAICRELPDGRLQLLDGHLRSESMGTETIPCLVLDLDENEALKFLATADPLGAMAETDVTQLTEIMEQFEIEDTALKSMLDDILLAEGQSGGATESSGPNALVDKMALLPNEHYDYVLVLARTTHEWQELCYLLGIQKVRFPDRKRSVGVGRAITADKVLKLLHAAGVTVDAEQNPEPRTSQSPQKASSPPQELDPLSEEDELFMFGGAE